jgi:hypothetical protein
VSGPTLRRAPGLWTLVQLLMELMADRSWGQVTITLQAGKIENVHIDRSYKLDQLPIRDWSGQQAIAGGGVKLLAADK